MKGNIQSSNIEGLFFQALVRLSNYGARLFPCSPVILFSLSFWFIHFVQNRMITDFKSLYLYYCGCTHPVPFCCWVKGMISLIYLLVQNSLCTHINHYFITFNRQSFIFWGMQMSYQKCLSFCRSCHWHPVAEGSVTEEPCFFSLDYHKGRLMEGSTEDFLRAAQT